MISSPVINSHNQCNSHFRMHSANLKLSQRQMHSANSMNVYPLMYSAGPKFFLRQAHSMNPMIFIRKRKKNLLEESIQQANTETKTATDDRPNIYYFVPTNLRM